MCLHRKDKTIKKDIDVGYKVFKVLGYRLTPVYQPTGDMVKDTESGTYILNTEYQSSKGRIILTTGKGTYPSGFHICETVDGAKEFQRIHCSLPGYHIYKVEFNTIVASGYQHIDTPVIVARKMTILEKCNGQET